MKLHVEAGGTVALCDPDGMPLRYMRTIEAGRRPSLRDAAVVAREAQETRTPFSGPIYYDDSGWR
jgi:hypothetical protein